MNRNENQTSLLGQRSGVVLLCFIAIIGVLLVSEHRAHVLGALPYFLLLACPLLHLFHYQDHSHQATGHGLDPPSETKPLGPDRAEHDRGGAS